MYILIMLFFLYGNSYAQNYKNKSNLEIIVSDIDTIQKHKIYLDSTGETLCELKAFYFKNKILKIENHYHIGIDKLYYDLDGNIIHFISTERRNNNKTELWIISYEKYILICINDNISYKSVLKHIKISSKYYLNVFNE